MEKYKHFVRMSVEEHFQCIDSTFWAAEKLLERPSKAAIMTRYFRDVLIRHSNTKQTESIKRLVILGSELLLIASNNATASEDIKSV